MAPATLLLLFTFSCIFGVASASDGVDQETPTYFSTTTDVTLRANPVTVYEGLTKQLTVTCIFSKQQKSDFGNLLALILSKEDESSPNRYRELAAITSVSGEDLEQKHSLGAHVTGAISRKNDSFIEYKWAWPGKEGSGHYYCEAHGWDSKGHPRMSTAAVDVVVRDTIDVGEVNTTLKNLEARLDNCSNDSDVQKEHIKKLESSEDDLKKQLSDLSLNSKNVDAVLQYTVLNETGVVWRGHTYFTSRKVVLDVVAAHRFCVLLGGYLVEINDEEEYTFVRNELFQNITTNDYVVIGTWDTGHEGHWTFIRSEEPMTVFHWNNNEPNGNRTENCINIMSGSADYNMNDIPCKRDRFLVRFVCEISGIITN